VVGERKAAGLQREKGEGSGEEEALLGRQGASVRSETGPTGWEGCRGLVASLGVIGGGSIRIQTCEGAGGG